MASFPMARQLRSSRAMRWFLGTLLPLALIPINGPSGRHNPLSAIGWLQGPALPNAFAVRWDFSYAYFPPLNEVVLFGGSPKQQGDTWWNDTWIFKDGAWSAGPAAPAELTPRGGAAMAYDPAIGKIVLFGGAGSSWPPLAEP